MPRRFKTGKMSALQILEEALVLDCLSISHSEKTFSPIIEKTEAQTYKEVSIITQQVSVNPE